MSRKKTITLCRLALLFHQCTRAYSYSLLVGCLLSITIILLEGREKRLMPEETTPSVRLSSKYYDKSGGPSYESPYPNCDYYKTGREKSQEKSTLLDADFSEPCFV